MTVNLMVCVLEVHDYRAIRDKQPATDNIKTLTLWAKYHVA